jgi:hypothetical protein
MLFRKMRCFFAWLGFVAQKWPSRLLLEAILPILLRREVFEASASSSLKALLSNLDQATGM